MNAKIPKEAGAIVSMIEFQGHVMIACEFAVFRVRKEFDISKLEEVDILETVFTVPHPAGMEEDQ